MLIQRVDALLVRLGIQTHGQIVAGKMVDPFIGLERAINPFRQLLFVLNTQQHAIVTP